MKFYEIKLHLRGVYVMREYSLFIQFIGCFVLIAKIIELKAKKPIAINHYWLLFYKGGESCYG